MSTDKNQENTKPQETQTDAVGETGETVAATSLSSSGDTETNHRNVLHAFGGALLLPMFMARNPNHSIEQHSREAMDHAEKFLELAEKRYGKLF